MLAFGVVVAVVGVSDFTAAPGWSGIHWVALSALAVTLAGMGASDEVSAIFRQTMLIQAAPDQMRGRLQGIFIVVVTGGPRIGDMYAGVLATAVALWCPPLLGGVGIIVLIAVLTRLYRSRSGRTFREYDARQPTP